MPALKISTLAASAFIAIAAFSSATVATTSAAQAASCMPTVVAQGISYALRGQNVQERRATKRALSNWKDVADNYGNAYADPGNAKHFNVHVNYVPAKKIWNNSYTIVTITGSPCKA